jgi:glycosyltransferase involved in cell wall biosynthesis
MPAYNSEAFIGESVRSVLAQTFADIELIVIDDGSIDGTAAKLAEFRDPRLRVIRHESNRGVSAAGNTGIQAATGTFIGCIGSDDVWLPTKLEEQVALLEREPDVGVVYSWLGLMDSKGRASANVEAPDLDENPIAALASGRCLVITTALVSTENLEKLGSMDQTLKAGEDWDLFMRLALAGLKFKCIRKPLVYARVRPDSLSRDPANAQMIRVAFEKLESLFPLYPDVLTPKVLGGAAFRSAQWSISMEHARNALHFLVKSTMLNSGVVLRPVFVREVLTLAILVVLPRRWYRSLRDRFGPDSSPRNAASLTMA